MPLSPSEEAKLQNFFASRYVTEDQKNRIKKIAVMSKEGFSTPKIQKKIGGSTNDIAEFRMKLRKAGVW